MPSSKLSKYWMQSDKCIRKIHDDIGILHIIYFGSRPHIIFQNTMKQMCRMIKNIFGKLNSRKMDRSFTIIFAKKLCFNHFLSTPCKSWSSLLYLLYYLGVKIKVSFLFILKWLNLAKLRRVKNVLYMLLGVHIVTYSSFRFMSPSNASKGKFFKLSKLFCIFLE